MKNFQWFIRKGIFYIPAGIPGWTIFALASIFAFYFLFDIDSRSHSVSDTLVNFIFNLILIGLLYTLIAFFTEKEK